MRADVNDLHFWGDLQKSFEMLLVEPQTQCGANRCDCDIALALIQQVGITKPVVVLQAAEIDNSSVLLPRQLTGRRRRGTQDSQGTSIPS